MVDSTKRWTEAYSAVVQHLESEGGGNWKAVRDRFPDVPEPTFWRYVKRAKEAASGKAEVDAARKKIAEFVSSTAATRPDAVNCPGPEKNLPSEVLGFRRLDLLGHVDQLFEDIELLREYAMTEDGCVKNPHFFAQAALMRDRALTSAMRVAEASWGLQQMFDFYDAVVAVVATIEPAAAVRVMEALGALLPAGDNHTDRMMARPPQARPAPAMAEN